MVADALTKPMLSKQLLHQADPELCFFLDKTYIDLELYAWYFERYILDYANFELYNMDFPDEPCAAGDPMCCSMWTRQSRWWTVPC